MVTNPKVIRSVCHGCGNEGDVKVLEPRGKTRFPLVGVKPDWCTCAKSGGPYEAPKGYVAKFTFGR